MDQISKFSNTKKNKTKKNKDKSTIIAKDFNTLLLVTGKAS